MASCSWSSGLTNAPTLTLNIYQNSNSNTGTYSLVMKRPGKVVSSDSKEFSVTINGTKVKSGTVQIGGLGDLPIASGNWSVAKNPNGQTTFSFSFYCELGLKWSGSSTGNASGNGSTTIYYPKATYTVSYNANGGSGAPSSQTKTYGTTLKLSSTVPKRTGYTFQGWSTANDSSVEYKPGSNYTSNSSVTLYAVWKLNVYTVTFNCAGYTFQGWSTANDSSVEYKPGSNYTSNSSVTLYAVWKLNVYTVTFNCAGGNISGNSTYTKQINHGSKIGSLPSPTRNNYTFLGWYLNDTKIDENYVITQNITFTAKWKMNAVVYYKSNGNYELHVPFLKVDNSWFVVILYIKVDDTWERSVV